MRMLTAQALADAGEISVLGYELPRQSKQARLEMGVVPQLDNLDVELTLPADPDGVRAPVQGAPVRAQGGGGRCAGAREPRAIAPTRS